MVSSALNLGQCLKGRLSIYTITKEIHDSVWLATNASKQIVVIKSVRHVRLENERKLLKRFQELAPLRRMIDEVHDPADPPAIVLQYYDCHTGEISDKKGFSSREIKCVARTVLQALHVLHENGFVHADVKPDNILVNRCDDGAMRFKDVCLSDLGGTISVDSEYAVNGYPLGTPIFRSPETTMALPFGPPADIWSLGATLISLAYGQGFDLFRPNVPMDDELYDDKIVERFYQFFGPFPQSYLTLSGMTDEILQLLADIMNNFPQEQRKPFQRASSTEIANADRDFIAKLMKLDPRDRPTAAELLEDTWFADLEETRICNVDA